MALRLNSVAVAVRDRKRATKWYTSKLGLRVKADDREHWVTVTDRRGVFQLHLCELGRKPRPSDVGNTGILFMSSEPVQQAYARLRRKGVRFSVPLKEFPWGWVAKFRDPDGNEFWLMPA